MRGTFTPVYAGGSGGTVCPGGMMIPSIGAMSLSSRYETPRSRVLSLVVMDWLRRTTTWML